MTELDLTKLDRLEREATAEPWSAEEGEGWIRSLSEPSAGSRVGQALRNAEPNADFIAAARNQLRPLLDFVERLGVSLEDAATALHADRAHEGKFWDCGRFGCLTANTLVAEWKQAKEGGATGVELSADAKEWLECIEECDGAEVHEEAWVYAEELKAAGLITLSGARGPGNAWKRASLAPCDRCGRSGD